MTTGHALKVAGQQDSLLMLLDEPARFDRIIAAFPPGAELSINDVREALDDAGVPVRARGGLFSGAVSAGLLRPAVMVHRGREYPVTEPSTGKTANASHVRVYVRTEVQP